MRTRCGRGLDDRGWLGTRSPGMTMPDEVHGVGGGDLDFNVGGFAAAGGAEAFDGLREGELLAAEAGDEAASTDLAAGFEAAEDAEEVAPFGGVRFAGEEVAEEDAVAVQEHAGGGFEGGVECGGLAAMACCWRASRVEL